MTQNVTNHAARPLIAPSLPVAILETIDRWFKANGRMPDQKQILAALGACIADQALQHPDAQTQTDVINTVIECIIAGVNAENGRRRAIEPSITPN